MVGSLELEDFVTASPGDVAVPRLVRGPADEKSRGLEAVESRGDLVVLQERRQPDSWEARTRPLSRQHRS